MNTGPFSRPELIRAVLKLKSGKATLEGDIPIECFKSLSLHDVAAADPFLEQFNDGLRSSRFPSTWLTARIAMSLKKGIRALVGNYKPISLLSFAFNMMRSMVEQRLLNASIDDTIWKSQFGLKRKHGTLRAIYVARRRIELAVNLHAGLRQEKAIRHREC